MPRRENLRQTCQTSQVGVYREPITLVYDFFVDVGQHFGGNTLQTRTYELHEPDPTSGIEFVPLVGSSSWNLGTCRG